MRRRFAKRWRLQWVTSRAMRHFVKTTLDDSGMREPYLSFRQGHKPNRNDMNVVYGVKPIDEMLVQQAAYLPSGPTGLFADVRVTAGGGLPPELEHLYQKLRAHEIDAEDFARRAKALAWGPSAERAGD